MDPSCAGKHEGGVTRARAAFASVSTSESKGANGGPT